MELKPLTRPFTQQYPQPVSYEPQQSIYYWTPIWVPNESMPIMPVPIAEHVFVPYYNPVYDQNGQIVYYDQQQTYVEPAYCYPYIEPNYSPYVMVHYPMYPTPPQSPQPHGGPSAPISYPFEIYDDEFNSDTECTVPVSSVAVPLTMPLPCDKNDEICCNGNLQNSCYQNDSLSSHSSFEYTEIQHSEANLYGFACDSINGGSSSCNSQLSNQFYDDSTYINKEYTEKNTNGKRIFSLVFCFV